jgi:cytochrome c2
MNLFKKIITFKPSFTARIIWGLFSFIAMLGVCFAVGISDMTGRLGELDINFKARSVEAGAKTYTEQCARCHGLDGKGVDGLGPTLSHISFVGKAEERIGAGNVLEVNEVTKSQRLQALGWSGSLLNYVRSVTAGGVPVKTPGWDKAHPTFGQTYGGNLREDEVNNVANYVVNWALQPYEGDDIVKPIDISAGPTPTPIPLTAEQEKGKGLVVSLGCNACHAIRGVMDGGTGPNLTKIASVSENRIKDAGYTKNVKDQPAATTAEEYIIQSIHNPNAYIVPQCPQGPCAAGVMPQNFKDSIPAEDFTALVAYLLTLR